MRKQKILHRVHAFGSLAFEDLMDLKDELKTEKLALLRVCEAEDVDDVKDPELHKLGAQLNDLIQIITLRADSLSDWLDKIEEVDLCGF